MHIADKTSFHFTCHNSQRAFEAGQHWVSDMLTGNISTQDTKVCEHHSLWTKIAPNHRKHRGLDSNRQ